MIKGSLGFGSNKLNFIIFIWFLLLNLFTCWSLMQKVIRRFWYLLNFWYLYFWFFSLPYRVLFNFPSRYFTLSLSSFIDLDFFLYWILFLFKISFFITFFISFFKITLISHFFLFFFFFSDMDLSFHFFLVFTSISLIASHT